MSIVFNEHAESRQFTQTVNGQGQRLRWWGRGSTDEAAIRAALISLMPTTWDGLTLTGWDAKPHGPSSIWDCTADYSFSTEQAGGVKTITTPSPTDPLGPEFEFDLTAQQAHITQSLLTVTSRFDTTKGGVNAVSWAASTAYVVGDVVKNGTDLYTCVTAGTSAGSGGPTGTGTGISDGTAVWDYVSAATSNVITLWTAATAYSAGDRVDSHGFLYTCGGSGTSAATGDGPTGTSGSITDGTCNWAYTGADIDPKAPGFGRAIAVTRDRVVGTDVYVGSLEFSITKQVYPVTLNLISTMLNLIGTFNRDTYYNFPTKTLLYLGCTGAPRPGNIWTLKHRFACSKNLRNVEIGSKITMPFKGGWDFLWCAYTDGVAGTGTAKYPVQVPYAAYVEQVYRPGDFGDLPI